MARVVRPSVARVSLRLVQWTVVSLFGLLLAGCGGPEVTTGERDEEIAEPRQPRPVRRVRLRVSEAGVTYLEELLIDNMVLPASRDLPARTGERFGFWYEARDGRGEVVYQVLGGDPTRFEIEVPDANGAISRERGGDEVLVDVLVPKETTDLTVYSSRRFDNGQLREGPADEIASFPLGLRERTARRSLDRSIETVKILDNGDDGQKWNILVLGDGFLGGEHQDAFNAAAQNFVTNLEAEPWYKEYGSAFNVHRVNVVSAQAGADDPADCPDGTKGSGAEVDTAFDASFCANDTVRRALRGKDSLVQPVADKAVPKWHVYLVLVNSTQSGASATNKGAWTSLGANSAGLALHELGHTILNLADEYGCLREDGCGPPVALNRNVTTATTLGQLTWKKWVAEGVSIPTIKHATSPDCPDFDESPNILESDNAVGLFEGGGHQNCGLYRPGYNCRMRTASRPFCGWCEHLLKIEVEKYVGGPSE